MQKRNPAADWISYDAIDKVNGSVVAYRLRFNSDRQEDIRLNVSADQRFRLYFDGKFVGEGPHRGDPDHWCYHPFEISCTPGVHCLVAIVWSIGHKGGPPTAQMSVRHGFVAWSEAADSSRFNTGRANWESSLVAGYGFLSPGVAWGSGARVRIDGKSFPFGIESGNGSTVWTTPVSVAPARCDVFTDYGDLHLHWTLVETRLPPMLRQVHRPPSVRMAEDCSPTHTELRAFDPTNNRPALHDAWQALLNHHQPILLPPNSSIRVLLDLGTYSCAFANIRSRSGRGTRIRVRWSESLFVDQEPKSIWPFGEPKGHRDEISGKYFRGMGNQYILGGGDAPQTYSPLWWEAGRYIEVLIITSDEPATIEEFELVETRYPTNAQGHYESSEPVHADVVRLGARSLAVSAHETLMDCPYYEQLQYAGDARLQALVSFVIEPDSRLQKRAIELIQFSRLPGGLTQSRYPSRGPQVIPPFSLVWIGMVHDYWMYRGDEPFVRSSLGTIRSVLDIHLRQIDDCGILQAAPGWGFVDWVREWDKGVPPESANGASSIRSLQAIIALQQAASIERAMGIPELGVMYEKYAAELFKRTLAATWDLTRHRLADLAESPQASEHAHALALISGLATQAQSEAIVDALLHHDDLTRATVYFSHYVFEALTLLGRADAWQTKLDPWIKMRDLGLHTTLESPEPARSDCHPWGAHPIFHFHSGILGVRPAAPGFAQIRINPQLGHLMFARGATAHPRGWIITDFKTVEGQVRGFVDLPHQTSGSLLVNGKEHQLREGRHEF